MKFVSGRIINRMTKKLRLIFLFIFTGLFTGAMMWSQAASAVVSVGFAPGVEASPTGLTAGQINALKSTTFNTLVLFSITIETNGDFYYGGGGGTNIQLCTGGTYVGPANWGTLLSQCKSAPSSINRIEMCIGGWEDQSFLNIKNIIATNGSGSSSILYMNLSALKNALGLTAMDYDDEYEYDSASAILFGKMCGTLGMKVTLCPYTNPSYWQAVKSGLGITVDYVYLQCYSGGQGNDPGTWNSYFGSSVPVLPGDWDQNGSISFLNQIQVGANEGCVGGWYWPSSANGTAATYQLELYGDLINAAFSTNIYWQGGNSDFNVGTSWVGSLVPGPGTNAINDSGSNNLIQINPSDPFWSPNGLWAGDETNATGAYIQNGSAVNATNTGNWLRLGDCPGAVGYYTLNSGILNLSNNLVDVGESGTGILNLNGGSAYLGNLVVGVNSGGAGTVTFSNSLLNVLEIVGGNNSATSILNLNGGTVQASANNTSFMNGLTTADIEAGGVTFDSQNYNIAISQALSAGSSGGGLTKIGSGNLTLTGYNTFTGPTVVNAGMLTINGANNTSSVLSDTASLTINNGATVSVIANNSLFGYGSYVVPITINAGGALTISNSSTAHIKGLIYLNGGTLASFDTGLGGNGTWNLDQGSVTVNGPATSTISALNVLLASPTTFNVSSGATNGIGLSVPGYFYGGALVKSGAGTMVLSGTNTYTGGTLISGGTLQLGDGINRNGVISGNITNNGTLVFANPNVETYGNVVSGSGSLVKTGSGTLTLSTASTYTGSTTISSGTLALTLFAQFGESSLISVMAGTVLDASGSRSQTVTVGSGQILKGSGSVNGKLNAVSGSIVNPGDNIGTLTVQNGITLGGQLTMELNRTNQQNCDQLASVSGTIVGGGTLTVTNLGPPLQLGDTFQLFNQHVNGFTTINLPNVSPYGWANNLAVNGTIEVAPALMNPTNITTQVTGNNLELSWPLDHTGWQLQVQTNQLAVGLGTNWSTISASTTTNQITFPIYLQNGCVFFRLMYTP